MPTRSVWDRRIAIAGTGGCDKTREKPQVSPDFLMRQKRLDDFFTAAKLILWVDVRGEALLPLDRSDRPLAGVSGGTT
jgi:hypothetical protein